MKFYTTVFLDPVDPQGVVPALTAALAPFDMNDYRGEFDPTATWDRWRLPSHEVLPVRRRWRGPRAARDGGVVFAAPKVIVDFDAMRRGARRHAAGAWDAWAAVVRAHPGALPRAHFEELHADRSAAQQAFMLQPAVQEVAQAAVTQRHPYFDFTVLLADPVAYFGVDRDAFIARAEATSVTTHAYVTLDGQWLSELTDDRGPEAHALAMTEYIGSVPDDTVIARVYCHG
ncbi:hypothetical protein [Dactylosporangium salmoneum]|uniref:EthD domain-containing protein n=1 Tax=Dactylosporangium salmoneum TaxID=53361 RepID=A0ABN3GFE7_9ACTN